MGKERGNRLLPEKQCYEMGLSFTLPGLLGIANICSGVSGWEIHESNT